MRNTKKHYKRGEIRIVISTDISETIFLITIRKFEFAKHPLFEIRYFDTPPEAMGGIVDRKITSINVCSANEEFASRPALMSDETLVGLMQNNLTANGKPPPGRLST
jgi:hypothetical protein